MAIPDAAPVSVAIIIILVLAGVFALGFLLKRIDDALRSRRNINRRLNSIRDQEPKL